MKKTTKLNTTLLIITTLIAFFFLTKWVYQVWPRYEWIESEVINKEELSDCVTFSKEICSESDYNLRGYDFCDYNTKIQKPYIYYGFMGTEYNATTTYIWCYKSEKEKVRINL